MEATIEKPQTVQTVYDTYLKSLSKKAKLELMALLTSEMAQAEPDITPGEAETKPQKPKRSIMELRGLGKEIWQEIDTDAYIREMRDEWDQKR